MKSTKRLVTILGSVVVLSLLVVANVWAFGVGNVDGVWGKIEDGGGASCDGWASAGVPAFSASCPAIQSSGGNLVDENRVAYGDPAYTTYSCPVNWEQFQYQSGFGFDGINGPISGLMMDTPFYLGSFRHYNHTILSPDNSMKWVDLDLTVPIDCDGNGTTDTSFAFSPRFSLDETSNDANPCPYLPGDPVNENGCADAVTISQPATANFVCSSVQYTVNIYGFTSNDNCSTVFDPNSVATQYITKEAAINEACLWAEIDRPVADAAVSKSCTNFGQGDPYYTVTVTNSGPGTALGAHIVDTLPSGVTFVSATSTRTVGGVPTSQGTCTAVGQTVTCDLNAALPESTGDPTAKWEVIIYVDYASGTDWTNTVTLSTTSEDTNPANNTATAVCASEVDVAVTKSDGDYEYPYASLTNPFYDYTLTVTNNGPDPAANVRVVDTLDDHTSFDVTHGDILINGVPDTDDLCVYENDDANPGGGTLTCNLGDMENDEVITITFWVKIEPGVSTTGLLEIADACSFDGKTGDICNTVHVYTDSNDTDTSNNIAYEPKDVALPTAVDLLYFEGTGAKNSVILEWATASEIDTIGFNIYRRRTLDGKMNQVNSLMIQAVSTGAVEGATYQFRVTGLKPGKFYYFWLEEVDVYGNTTLYGPKHFKAKRRNP